MMKRLFLFLLALLCSIPLFGQNTYTVLVRDQETGEPLTGATVILNGTSNGGITDTAGFVQIKNIPDGKQIFIIRFIGYRETYDTITFPHQEKSPREVFLIHDETEFGEVIVTATRSSRTIDDEPTRVEAISGEEINEKGNMKPGEIRMLLNESTGIQTQQTSATSLNTSLRIQGLDGKYTQILRDGYPIFSGFSGGLGLLQIAPLDLAQVEVIKGSSSTLYGGGAIAGLVNLVSKKPHEERELNFLLNGTSARGIDLSGFYAEKFNKTGTTLFASYNSGAPYDPAGIGLSAIPRFHRVTLNPKLFLYPAAETTLDIGFNSTIEERTGGDMQYLEGRGDSIHSFFEKNKTNRLSTQFGVQHMFTNGSKLHLKNSISYYDRTIEIPNFYFSGVQFSTFTEAAYFFNHNENELVLGLNLWTEKFTQNSPDSGKALDYNQVTFGAFLQKIWNISRMISIEFGVRGDYQNEYGFFFLPRFSSLLKFNPELSLRFGGGLGYKTPYVFTEDAERIQFRNVLPIDFNNTEAERSLGGNLDINYRTVISDVVSFNINALIFYTQISKPLSLTATGDGFYEFLQTGSSISTKGIEAQIKFGYNNFKLFIGYTLADVQQTLNQVFSELPLISRHRFNNVLIYEEEDELKVGFEAYYYSSQKLNDGAEGKPFWICGLMVEKFWENYSVFINFENIFDTRQTKFDTIFTGTITNPDFRDIYAPVDGFVINGGIKLRL